MPTCIVIHPKSLEMKLMLKKPASRRGIATVEFALTAPLLIVFVFGIIEFWQVTSIRNMASQAAYEAVREGMLNGATADEVEQTARNAMSIVGARGVQVQVDPPVLNEDVDELSVTVTVPMGQNGWIIPSFYKAATIDRTASMRREVVKY